MATSIFADNTATAQETSSPKDVEVVLLFDVSGSMNQADPVNKAGTRMSIEAAYQFIFNYPSETNMYVTVIPYNSYVYTELEKVNVCTVDGFDRYCEYMEYILDNNLPKVKDAPNSFYGTCWKYQTDIGGALEEAKNTLFDSKENSKKAVILFTDGTAQLENEQATKECEEKARAASSELREANIPVYSIGLNCNHEVNKEFLVELSGEDNTEIVESTNDLTDVFARVYTHLVENSFLRDDIVAGGDEITVQPNKETTQKVRIYGDAVKEANISFSSKASEGRAAALDEIARLNSIKVTSPNGAVVANIDLKNPAKSSVKSEYCIVNYSPSGCSATIKLLEPMDGDWEISVTGEEGILIVKKINLFDLKMHSTLDVSEIFVGEPIKYEASIYNSEKNVHLTNAGLYSEADGASAMVEVYKTSKTLYNGVLNSTGSGFDFSVVLEEPGTYSFATTLYHNEFELNDTKEITVLGPTLSLTAQSATVQGNSVDLSLALNHPITNNPLTEIPKYLSGTDVKIVAYKDGNAVFEEVIGIEDLANGAYNCSFACTDLGEYTLSAEISYHDISIKSQDVIVSFVPSEISLTKTAVHSISHKTLSGNWSEEIDLSDMFSDSDGDELMYSVVLDDGSVFDVEIDDEELTIDAKAVGKTVITVVAYDGNGAEYAHEIELQSLSLMPLLIGIVIGAVVLIVLVVVFILILRKKSIISFKFKVKIELGNDMFAARKAVYSVPALTSRKKAKPKMTLDSILSSGGFGVLESIQGISNEEVQMFIDGHCKNLTLSGVPFKRAIKIDYTDPQKKKTRTYRLTSSIVTIKLADNSGVISIGRNNADF